MLKHNKMAMVSKISLTLNSGGHGLLPFGLDIYPCLSSYRAFGARQATVPIVPLFQLLSSLNNDFQS